MQDRSPVFVHERCWQHNSNTSVLHVLYQSGAVEAVGPPLKGGMLGHMAPCSLEGARSERGGGPVH